MNALEYVEYVDCPTCKVPYLADEEYTSPARIRIECRNCLDVSEITLQTRRVALTFAKQCDSIPL